MTTLDLTYESMRADLARKVLNADVDILMKVSELFSHLKDSNKDYYDSEEFYSDLEQAENDIQNGNYLSVSSKSDLDKLFAQ